MDKLIFKTFTWPENPERYRVESKREPVYNKNEDGTVTFGGLGPRKRVITGSGSFVGSDAYTNFKALRALTGDTTAGALVHPTWGTVTAFFTELTMEQEPQADYVAYSFTFHEADSDGAIPQ